MLDGRKNRDGGVQTSHDVGGRYTDFLGSATGQVIALAGNAHQSA